MIEEKEIKTDSVHAVKPEEIKIQTRVYRPKVDSKLCTKCHVCAVVCPHDAIDMKEDFPTINLNFCTGCLVCLRECPWNAIFEVNEER